MGSKEILLSQRARLAFWSPLLILILFVVAENSAWAVSEQTVLFIEGEEEDTMQVKITYHDDKMVMGGVTEQQLIMLEENFTGKLDLKSELETDYETSDDDNMDDLIDLAADVESDYDWIQIFLVIALLTMFILVSNPFKGSEMINGKSIQGSLLLLISLFALLSTLAVYSGLEEVMNELHEDDFDDVDAGFYGTASTVEEEGDNRFEAILTWGPGLAFWAIIGVFVISLVGGLANLSYLKEDLVIEDASIWFKSDNTPQWFTQGLERAPTILLGLATLSVLVAAFAPWYSVDQTWNNMDVTEDQDITNTSVHEFSWKLTPWNVIHTNDTFLEDGRDNATTSTDMTSYSNQPFITDSGETVMEMRWPMLCATLLLIGALVLNSSNKLQEQVKGDMKGWFLITSLLVMVVMTIGTSDFEKDMRNSAEEDLSILAPQWDLIDNLNHFPEDSFFGDQSIMRFNMEIEGESVFSVVEFGWGPSIGYYAAQIAPLLIVSGLVLMYGGEIVTVLENRKLPKFDLKNSEWGSRPTIICIIGLLVVSGLGTGMGNTLVDPAFSAPPGMYKWNLDSSSSDTQIDSGTITLGKDESHTFNLMPLDHYSDNLTSIGFWINCEEGDEGSNDNPDRLSWEITPPLGATTNGNTLSGTFDCGGWNGASVDFNSDWDIPDDVWAETEEMAISQAKFEAAYTETWVLTLDAEVNDGDDRGLPFVLDDPNDDNLEASYSISLQGRVGLTAEKS